VIDELMSDNDAAWVDDHAETSDFIELVNTGKSALALDGYALRDGSGVLGKLPAQKLGAGKHLVLFADAELAQGALHLPWKLDPDGERVELVDPHGHVVDRVEVPALLVNEAYARFPSGHGKLQKCRYATPERESGAQCGPPPPPEPPDESNWRPYTWPTPARAALPNAPKGPLVLTELSLFPAKFVEVMNISDQPVPLDYELHLDASGPGSAWPTRDDSPALKWPMPTLEPGERVTIDLNEADVQAITGTGTFEGVATLFDASGRVVDRVDFNRWPKNALLTRIPDADGALRFCRHATPGAPNDDCDPLMSRAVGDRLRHLYTPGDYDALAQGDTQLGLVGVKFVVDMAAGDVVHLLSTRAWDLHYTWIREKIEGQATIDRCDPKQQEEFNTGWGAFSDREYWHDSERHYLLGTLDRFAGSGMKTLDFAVSDVITGAQMQRAFFDVMGALDAEDPSEWALRPNEPPQALQMRTIEGQTPIVGQDAPLRGVRFQPLTPATSYGVLTFVKSDEIDEAELGPDAILVTDGVPNDIPFVAGLITEAFQTPLAHVNVLSQNRGTPNMALHDARHAPELEPWFGKLVELRVEGAGFHLREATAQEADAYWTARMPTGPRVAPRRDFSLRGVVDLRGRGLRDLPAIGAKAAQLAELSKIVITNASCFGHIDTPPFAFAIPLVHYVEHFEKSGARELLEQLMADPEFRGDAKAREAGLTRVQALITKAPLDSVLLTEVTYAVQMRFGKAHVRFRSSSNTEDLPGFNGAGLYVSLNGQIDDAKSTIDDAIRGVWASLWSRRAYDERELGHIDQLQVAMGVLVHGAFQSERANVIAISSDAFDATHPDIHTMNAQLGEASVALPAPGVVTEQIRYHARRPKASSPELEYQTTSSLAHGQHVLSLRDARAISCRLQAINDHFHAVLDPKGENRWFAVDTELKVVGDERRIVFKQARPYSFARAELPQDCRVF
jgi:hypothetical protein